MPSRWSSTFCPASGSVTQRSRMVLAGCRRHLPNLCDLEVLSLRGSPRITDAGLEHVAALKNLRSISLRGTGVSPAGSIRWPGIR
jgi:hypothetical protein